MNISIFTTKVQQQLTCFTYLFENIGKTSGLSELQILHASPKDITLHTNTIITLMKTKPTTLTNAFHLHITTNIPQTYLNAALIDINQKPMKDHTLDLATSCVSYSTTVYFLLQWLFEKSRAVVHIQCPKLWIYLFSHCITKLVPLFFVFLVKRRISLDKRFSWSLVTHVATPQR